LKFYGVYFLKKKLLILQIKVGEDSVLKNLIAASKYLESNGFSKESNEIGYLFLKYAQTRIESPAGDPYEYKLESGQIYTRQKGDETWIKVTKPDQVKAIEEKVFGITQQPQSPDPKQPQSPDPKQPQRPDPKATDVQTDNLSKSWYDSIPGYDAARKKYDEYFSGDPSPSGAETVKPLPFKNTQEGNAFREWINDNHTEWATSNSLDRSGPHDNQYMHKAWAQFGAEYEKSQKKEPEDIRSLIESIGIRWNSILKFIKNLYAGPVAARFFARYLASALPGVSFFSKDKMTEEDLTDDELAAVAAGIKAAEKRGDVRKSGYTALHYKDWMNAGAANRGVDTSDPNWQLKAPPPATVWGYNQKLPLPNTPEKIRQDILSSGKDPRNPTTRSEFGLEPLPSFTSGEGFARLTVGASDMYQQMAVTFGQLSFKKEGGFYVVRDKYDFVGGAARKASSLAEAKKAADSSGVGLESVEKLVQILEDKNMLKPFIFEIKIPTSMVA
jgi:hypothetical protein